MKALLMAGRRIRLLNFGMRPEAPAGCNIGFRATNAVGKGQLKVIMRQLVWSARASELWQAAGSHLTAFWNSGCHLAVVPVPRRALGQKACDQPQNPSHAAHAGSKESVKMQRERALSIGAMVLAFLASQHHTLHMLLLAAGPGGASVSVMTAIPLVRRVMLVMSLVIVMVMIYQMRKSKRPKSVRLMSAVSIVVTLGLVGWSVMQFGL